MTALEVFFEVTQTVIFLGILVTLVGFRRDRWGR